MCLWLSRLSYSLFWLFLSWLSLLFLSLKCNSVVLKNKGDNQDKNNEDNQDTTNEDNQHKNNQDK